MADEPLRWSVCQGADGSTVVVLQGELDSASEPAVAVLLKTVVDQGAPVAVDLGQLSFLDSSGLRCLLRAAQYAGAAGSELLVTNATGMVRRVIEITGLEHELLGHANTEEVERPVAS